MSARFENIRVSFFNVVNGYEYVANRVGGAPATSRALTVIDGITLRWGKAHQLGSDVARPADLRVRTSLPPGHPSQTTPGIGARVQISADAVDDTGGRVSVTWRAWVNKLTVTSSPARAAAWDGGDGTPWLWSYELYDVITSADGVKLADDPWPGEVVDERLKRIVNANGQRIPIDWSRVKSSRGTLLDTLRKRDVDAFPMLDAIERSIACYGVGYAIRTAADGQGLYIDSPPGSVVIFEPAGANLMIGGAGFTVPMSADQITTAERIYSREGRVSMARTTYWRGLDEGELEETSVVSQRSSRPWSTTEVVSETDSYGGWLEDQTRAQLQALMTRWVTGDPGLSQTTTRTGAVVRMLAGDIADRPRLGTVRLLLSGMTATALAGLTRPPSRTAMAIQITRPANRPDPTDHGEEVGIETVQQVISGQLTLHPDPKKQALDVELLPHLGAPHGVLTVADCAGAKPAPLTFDQFRVINSPQDGLGIRFDVLAFCSAIYLNK